ncbi:hypothetical protein NG821_08215 [Prevotella cerevisiae]|uniref:Uncharacterized protein n=1 Tax=Segatella cerevisiae TaxID=2053716 RepID=A0ABT1BXW6_9BACT|nr:hypothetical protein [Segatella cerevisiae]MCO6025819.1 hypothetical protein [Segatella cerevisiae]
MNAESKRKHKDYAVNHCIVTMLVLLASTGVETQAYHSALQLVLEGISNSGVNQTQETKAFENDILSIIRIIKTQSDQTSPIQHLEKDAFFNYQPRILSYIEVGKYAYKQEPALKSANQTFKDSIVIRGPNDRVTV